MQICRNLLAVWVPEFSITKFSAAKVAEEYLKISLYAGNVKDAVVRNYQLDFTTCKDTTAKVYMALDLLLLAKRNVNMPAGFSVASAKKILDDQGRNYNLSQPFWL